MQIAGVVTEPGGASLNAYLYWTSGPAGRRTQGRAWNGMRIDFYDMFDRTCDQASDLYLDLGRAPYVLYDVKYIDPVSLAP